MALKIKILDSNLEKIELMFFRNLSRQLKTLKIIVNSVVSIKIDQENLILQIPKKIENLKLWFYPAFSMEFSKTIKLKFLKNLKLSSEFQKEHEGLCFECPRIKDLSIYLPNKVGEKIVIEFFKRHLQLRTVKLTFTSLNFHEILSEIRKLAFLQRFTIIFKSTVNFSDKLLEELVEVLLEKGPEQEDLLKIEIEILK